MIRRIAFLALLATALFTVQGADCFASSTTAMQSMPCCRHMKCLAGHHAPQCCTTAPSSHPRATMPQECSSLSAPEPAILAEAGLPVATELGATHALVLGVVPHPPPDLYTLHSSLLI